MGSLKILRYILAVNEQRNFTAAARGLGISQPALSRAIQKLERDLGVPLFDRGKTEVVPTPLGKAYLRRAADVLGQLQEAEQELRLMSGMKKGTLRVGFGPVYVAGLAGPAVGRFVADYPNIELRISTGGWTGLMQRMQSGELDLYVGETSSLEHYAEYKIIPLSTQSGIFFCRPDHPLLEKAPVRVEELATYPLATLQLPTRAKIFLKNMVQLQNSPQGVMVARPAIECEDLFLTKRVVANSLAIGLAIYNLLRDEFKAGTLRELPVRGNRLATQGGVVIRDGVTVSPSAEAFISYLLESDNELAKAQLANGQGVAPAITTPP